MTRDAHAHGQTPATLGTVGKRGTVVIPAVLRRRLNIDEGALILIEEHEDGVLLRPARVQRVDVQERRAFFDELDRQIVHMKKGEPEAWQEMLEEGRLWDTTLMDGLDVDEVWSDEDLGLASGPE